MHELAMRHLAEQRSEQLIGQAERHNLAARRRPARWGRSGRTGWTVATLLARAGATGRRRNARPSRGYP